MFSFRCLKKAMHSISKFRLLEVEISSLCKKKMSFSGNTITFQVWSVHTVSAKI